MHVTNHGTYIIQGKRVTDSETHAQMIIPELEDCVEITKTAIGALLEEEDLGADPR